MEGSATSNIISVVSSEEGSAIEMTPLIGRNGEVLFQDLEEGEEGFFEGVEVPGETGIEMSELTETIASASGEGMSIFSAESQALADNLLGAGEGILETDALLEGGAVIAETGAVEVGAGIVSLPLIVAGGSAVAIYDLVQPDSKIYEFFGGKAPLDPEKDASASSETILARDPYEMAHRDSKGSYYLDQNARDQYYTQLVGSLNDGTERSDDEVSQILEQANNIKNGGDIYVYQNPDSGDIQTYQVPNEEQRQQINQQLEQNPNYFIDEGIPPIVVYNMGYNEALAYSDEDKQYIRGKAYGYGFSDTRTNSEIISDGNADLPRDEYKYYGLEKASEGDFVESGGFYSQPQPTEPQPTEPTSTKTSARINRRRVVRKGRGMNPKKSGIHNI